MSSKVAKFEEYARKQKEKKEIIELQNENNNLKKEVEKYKTKYEKLKESVIIERLQDLGFLE